MSTACLIATDLSRLRLISSEIDEVWSAPASDDPDEPTPLREIASLAADWLIERLPGRRLGRVCLDVDEARCLWIAAPTREPAVIAAALRQRQADWGEADVSGELVQPLVASSASGGLAEQLPMLKKFSSGRAETDGAVRSAAVLEAPDAAVRLLFDALDERGVRIGESCTLWHALAEAQASESVQADEVCAVVLPDDRGRVVWAWAAEEGLVAGGLCRFAKSGTGGSAEPVVGRLTLDWLTWSAQLGRRPSRVCVLGSGNGLVQAIEKKWPEATVVTKGTGEALRDLLVRDHHPAGDENDPRRSTPTLTRRPSRAHRRTYRLAALAIGLLAIGVAGLGVRGQQAASRFETARQQINTDARALVQGIAPGYESQPDLVESLQSFFLVLKRDNPQLPTPPVPQRIHAELDRLLAAAAPIDGVTVNRISIDDRTGSAQFRIATYADGEKLLSQLDLTASDEAGTIKWSDRVTGSPPNLVLRMTGLWQ